MKHLRGTGLMTRQYQNNYLLSRISGLAFDVMIVAGIASIEISDLKGLWLPFILLSAAAPSSPGSIWPASASVFIRTIITRASCRCMG